VEGIIKAMKAAKIPRIVLITPPPVHDDGRILHQVCLAAHACSVACLGAHDH
jgi:hypothetical protein